MRAFTSLVLLILASACAQAATHVCETKRAYTLEAGELRPYREEVERMSWKTVIFDDATGILKYGHEARTESMPEALPEAWRKMNQPYWVEEKLVVTSRGEVVTGHYKHNGVIFSAILIRTWTAPASFMWLAGGNSDALTGTCRLIGQ